MDRSLCFFLDAETDGLYGRFLSAAVLVTDSAGTEIEHLYAACAVAKEEISSEWVLENVFPHLCKAEIIVDSEYEMLERIWALWMKYRERAVCIADVGFPVEARLLSECVRHDLSAREFLAPFPLLDLSTMLLAHGMPWNESRRSLSGLDVAAHDPLNDVRLAAACWFRIFGALAQKHCVSSPAEIK